MPRRATFAHFDAAVAERFVATSADAGGLPGWLGIRFVEMTAGRLVAVLPVRDELLTPFKTLHGGVMAGLVDHVLGCVLYPLMPRGQWAATTEFKLNYLAPVFAGAELRAESTVVALGKRTAVVQVEVTNGEQLVCAAQGTLLISEPAKAER
jgi:1,4-dihydroxy-2-naphthoyl-CoA hydrolase